MAGYLLFGVLDTNYVMNTICIGYAMNELISIMENAGLMGLPLPAVVTKAIDILQKKAEREDN